MKKERKERRRLLKYLTVALLVWPVMFSLIFVARAATSWSGNGTIIADQLTFTWNAELTQHYNDNDRLSEENATASASGGSGTLTLSATTSTYYKKGSCDITHFRPGSNTITVTVTNASSFPLRFDKITHTGSAVVGVKPGDTLAVGGQFTVTLKASPMGEEDDTPRNASDSITFTVTELSDVTLTAVPSAHGSYSVGGLTVAENGEEQSVKLSAGTVVTPTRGTVDDGYSLLGWRLGDGSLVAVGSSITMNADVAIYPVIMPTGTSITGGPFSVGGTKYTFWEDAVYAAVKSGSTIILAADHTLPDTLGENAVIPGYGGKYVTPGEDGKVNFLLPMGTKLLIPYSDSDIGTFSAETTKTTTTPTTIPSAYRVLTVSSGATITNYGSINVNSTQYSSSATPSPKPGTGSPVGPYGQIVLEDGARLDLESGSNLYCYGYITGKGQVHAKTGSNSYEMMQIQDWIGGNNALPLNIRESFLFSQYYVQNIEAPVVFAYNAKLYVSATLTLNGDIQKTNGELMGPTGMFQLAEGATLTRTYDPLTDRVNYGLSGDMVTANLTIAMAGVTMDTGKKIFGIQNNFTFNIESGSTMTLSKKFKLLPSCEINVKEGGTLTVDAGAELFIYDVDDWGEYTIRGKLAPIYYSPTKAITRTAADLTSACLRVDGTLVANGAVYSTSGGEGLTGTGVFVNNVSATRTTMPEIQKGSKEVKVSVQPVVGILAGLSTSGSDYTKKFSNPQTYYGTPTVLDNDGNILKESAWYQYAVNVAAPAGKDLCYGVVAYNADDGGAYSLGGTYETATIGSATISNVVGYVANGQDASGNSASGTFRFKVQGYTVNSISASKGTLTGPDANGVYSLTGLTTHSTLTIDASDPITYTLAYVMSGEDYALYTANGGANTSAGTVEIGGQTYYVLASYSGQAGTSAPIPEAPAVADRQLLWQYADKTVPGGTIDVNKFADGETTAYVYGFYRSNTAENVNTGVQYTTFTEALVDAASGQEIRLLTDTGKYYEEPGESWTWAAAKTITIDLNGHTITGAITNNGTMTVDLNGGTLDYHTGATAAAAAYNGLAAVTNTGTLTIQDSSETGGGKIIADAIGNNGTLTNYTSVVRNNSGGMLTISDVTLESTQNVNAYSMVLFNYNNGKVQSLNNVTMTSLRGYAIWNYGGQIAAINGCTIETCNGIENRNLKGNTYTAAGGSTIAACGTIDLIKDSTITVGQYAILNRGVITELNNCTLTAHPDSAQVNTIGTTSVNANGNVQCYTIFNEKTWWTTDSLWKRTESGLTRTEEYQEGEAYRPTIGKIVDCTILAENTSTSAEHGYALYNNGGVIGEISGATTIKTYKHPSNAQNITSNYAIRNTAGGTIKSIAGTVDISATGYSAIHNDGQFTAKVVYTYPNTLGTNSTHEVTTYGEPSTITSISCGGTVSAGSYYAVYNSGHIGSITGGATYQSNYNTIYNSGVGAYASRDYTRKYTDTTTASTEYERIDNYVYNLDKGGVIGTISGITISGTGTNHYYLLQNQGYIGTLSDCSITSTSSKGAYNNPLVYNGDTRRKTWNQTFLTNRTSETDSHLTVTAGIATRCDRDYTFDAPTIGTMNNVTVTSTSTYAFKNSGKIVSMSGCTITGTQYALVNYTTGPYTERHTLQYYSGTSIFATSKSAGELPKSYKCNASEITTIDNCTIQTTSNTLALFNAGHIGTIQNSTVTAGTTTAKNSAIFNGGDSVREYTYNVEDVLYVTANAATACTASYGQNNESKVETYVYGAPTIELIGANNTISGASEVIKNYGVITAIDSGTDQSKITKVTASTQKGNAVYNLTGTLKSRTSTTPYTSGTIGTKTNADTYFYANIGAVKNLCITSNGYGILNGSSNSAYLPTIGELGEGLEIHANCTTADYAPVHNTTYAKIEKITGGIYTAAKTGTYAYKNANTNADHATLISGGDFKGGTNDDATSGRNYAIYDPDNTARQTYPTDMKLTSAGVTRGVTFADGTTATTGYYYLGPATVVAQFVGGATGEFATLQAAVAAYPETDMDGSTYIQMTDNSTEADVTIDRNIYLDLNGKTVTLTGGTNGTGTLTINEGCTLYGMDHTTDEYTDTAYGKISGTVSGTVAPVVQTELKADSEYSYYRYVAIKNGDELSFHRFNISVNGYRFELSSITPECALFFLGKFRGDSTARDYLKSVGFTLSDSNGTIATPSFALPADASTIPVVATEDEASDSMVVFKAPDTYLFEAYLIRAFSKETPSTYQEKFGATATVTFNNDKSWTSEKRELSYLEAWQKVTEISNEDKARLNAFLRDLGEDQIS